MGVSELERLIAEIEGSAQALMGRLEELIASCRKAREDGGTMEELARWCAQEGRDARLASAAAMKRVAAAITAMRGEVVRGLVDEEGWTITAAARSLSVSRQMAARLYRLGQEQRVQVDGHRPT